jgi:HD superfamily phosphohydrolase
MRIRDAIWGDMEFSSKEEAIVRTSSFQRLHRIKQLGNAWHVYPSAMHTRFEHSLGVCHVSKVLCEKASIPQEEREEIALAALLHDITHVPFAHTLGGQLALLPNWEKKALYRRRFKDIQNELECMESETLNPKDKWRLIELLNDEGFLNMASGNPSDLEKPYKAEVIGDSFCADLLDYLHRDVRFCGLKREYDPRILDHVTLLSYGGKQHLGLDITAPSLLDDRVRSPSVVSEYIHLLLIRYTLSERVYFYGAKLEADALLSQAFRIMLDRGDSIGGKSPGDFLYDTSDEMFIEALSYHSNPAVSYLARRLRNRHLPRCIHEIGRTRLKETELGFVFNTFRGRKNLSKWLEVEKEIADKVGISPADIIIQSHEPEMSLKGAKVLIRDEDGRVRRLDEYKEIPEARRLEEAHRELWRLYVFSGERGVEIAKNVRTVAKEALDNLLREET